MRSAFPMSGPDVASSDPTSLQTTVRHAGEELVLNGWDWFIASVAHPQCNLLVVMYRHLGDTSGATGVEAESNAYHQNSMVLVLCTYPPTTCWGNGVLVFQWPMRACGQCELTLEPVTECKLERKAFGNCLAD